MQLTNPRDGMTYTGLTRIAQDTDIQLFAWKQGRELWRYVVWDMADGSVSLTGPQMRTKRDLFDRAEYVATRLWDLPASALTI